MQYIVKAFTGYKTGWKEIKRFGSAAEADKWLCEYIKKNGYAVSDFTVKVIK